MSSINLRTHQWAQSRSLSSRFLPETTSTNDVARSEFPSLNKDEALFLADHQTQGRGRDGRTWQNMSGGEILLSTWCFRSSHPVQPCLTPLLGLGLYESLKKIKNDLSLRLKAPNDIFLNEGKLCGLLVEVSSQGDQTYIYIGLGMNVSKAPQIDISTSYLVSELSIDSEWNSFCENFSKACREAISDSKEFQLNSSQCERLLSALNQGLKQDEQYIAIHPQCDLETSQGKISWMDL